MHKPQEQVREFHKVMGKQPTSPAEPAIREAELRAKLILEEAIETAAALVGTRRAYNIVRNAAESIWEGSIMLECNLIEAIDGVCDLLYVTYGTAEAIGIDIEPFFNEVHRANLTKLGGGQREDGKYIKPPGWTPPDIAGVLARIKR